MLNPLNITSTVGLNGDFYDTIFIYLLRLFLKHQNKEYVVSAK